MNGSVGAAFGLLCMDSGGIYGLERYLILDRIIRAFNEEDGRYGGSPEDHFEPFKGQHLRDAFAALEALMIAHQHRGLIRPNLETYNRNVARSSQAAMTA
jgi:hypothetical protein